MKRAPSCLAFLALTAVAAHPWSNPSLVATGPIPVSADGLMTLKYYSADVAGNTDSTKTVSLKLDLYAPATTATVAASYVNTASITAGMRSKLSSRRRNRSTATSLAALSVTGPLSPASSAA